MFKSLKQKLGDGLANVSATSSPGAKPPGGPAGTPQQRQDSNASGSLRQHTNSSATSTPQGTPAGSLVDLRGPSSSQNDLDAQSPIVHGNRDRSRTSSISSQTSDAASFMSATSAQPFTPTSTQRSIVTVDGSEVSEAETEDGTSGTSVTALSKDELYQMFNKVQRRGLHYRNRLAQVMAANKELEKERDKLKTTLTQSQDKVLRRVSELKEQIELDKGAKKDLENNYMLMLDEKDEFIAVLRTQIRLLRDGKQIPEELLSKSGGGNQGEDEGTSATADKEIANISPEEVIALKEKVKRLEVLLNKCKETITANKERTTQLTTDRESISKQLQAKTEELDKLREQHDESVEATRNQLREARRLISDLESSAASSKEELRVGLEKKDAELQTVIQRCNDAQKGVNDLNEVVEKLKKQGEEQLEKAREIIRRMKEEKKALEEELKSSRDVKQASTLPADEAPAADILRLKEENKGLQLELSSAKEFALSSQEKLLSKEQDLVDKIRLLEQMTKDKADTEAELQGKKEELALAEETLRRTDAERSDLEVRLSSSSASEVEMRKRMESSMDTINRLEQRISDLMDRENHLNTELEQTKVDNERRLVAQQTEMSSLRAMIGQLQSSEQILKEQMEAANRRCDEQLSRADEHNSQAMGLFSTQLMSGQSELMNILSELEAAKNQSNEIVANLEHDLEERTMQLEAACRRIDELMGATGDHTSTLEENAVLPTEANEDLKELDAVDNIPSNHVASTVSRRVKIWCQGLDGVEIGRQGLDARNNNVSVAIQDRDELILDLRSRLNDAESSLGLLQDRLKTFEASIVERDGSASEEFIKHIDKLEKILVEKDKKIFGFEFKVNEFGEHIRSETATMKERSAQVEQLLYDKDEQLREKDMVIVELNKTLAERTTLLEAKSNEVEELQKKLQQLQIDAKARMLQLNNKLKAKESELEQLTGNKNQESASDGTSSPPREKEEVAIQLRSDKVELCLEAHGQEADLEKNVLLRQLEEQREAYEREKKEMIADHEAVVKRLNSQLAEEETSMYSFRDSVKKQFEDRQLKVKAMIETLQESCERSLRDRDDVHEIKLKNFEREKNKEKEEALAESRKALDKAKAELEQSSAEHEQLKTEYERIKTDLGKNQDQSLTDSKQLHIELEQSKAEADRLRTALENLQVELERARSESEDTVTETTTRHIQEMDYVRGELESSKVRLRETVAQYQSEKEALLKHLEVDRGELIEKTKALEAQLEAGWSTEAALREELERLRESARLSVAKVEAEQVQRESDDEKRLNKHLQEMEGLRIAETSKIEELSQQVSKATEELKCVLEQRDNAVREKAEHADCLIKQVSSFESLQAKFAESETMRKSLDEEVASQRTAIARSEQERSELLETLADCRRRLQTELSDHDTMIQNLEAKLTISSDEYKMELTKLVQQREELVKDHEMRIVAVEAEHKNKLERIEQQHAAEIEELKRAGDLKNVELVKEHTARITDLERVHAAKVVELLQGYDGTVGETVKRFELQLADMKAAHDETIRQLSESHEKRVADIAELHNVQLGEAVQLHDAKTAELTFIFDVKLAELVQGHDLKVTELKQDYEEKMVELVQNHAANVAELASQHETKVTYLVHEHDAKVVELQQEHEAKIIELEHNHEERVAEMERSDVELNKQLKELTTRLASLTTELDKIMEEKSAIELNVEEQRKMLSSANECHADALALHEAVVDELRLDIAERDARILELSEQLECAKTAVMDTEQKLNLLKAESVTHTNISGNVSVHSYSIGNENGNGCLSENETSNHTGATESHATDHIERSVSKDMQQRATLDSRLQKEVELLRAENKSLLAQLSKLQFVGVNGALAENDMVPRSELDTEIERLKTEYRSSLKQMEDEHNAKVVQLVKDVKTQMLSREREISDSLSNNTESGEHKIHQLVADHRQEVNELHELLDERDTRIDEMTRVHTQLKASEAQNKTHVDRLNSIVEELQQKLLDMEHDLEVAQRSRDASTERELETNVTATFTRAEQLGSSSEGLWPKEDGRGIQFQELMSLGGEDAFQMLELQNMNLQAEVNRQMAENAKAKIRERELSRELEMLRSCSYQTNAQHQDSHRYGSGHQAVGPLLTEPTEQEYLRNILFKYMTGLETKTLARVICTVVKFSDEQTRTVLEKEESRNSKHLWSPSSSSTGPIGVLSSALSGSISPPGGKVKPPSTRRTAQQPKSPPDQHQNRPVHL